MNLKNENVLISNMLKWWITIRIVVFGFSPQVFKKVNEDFLSPLNTKEEIDNGVVHYLVKIELSNRKF